MNILYFTYPWAMQTPGGGERQLCAYRNHLTPLGVTPRLYDMWAPRLDEHQILHCFSVMPGTLELCSYAKRHGLRLVVSPNLWVTPETKEDYPYDLIWNLLYLADKVIVNSNVEGDNLSNVYGMHRSKFHVVYNAVEADFVLPSPADHFRAAYGITRPYVLNVANVEPRKNQLAFIRALRNFPDLDFVIAGHVRDEDYARQCAAEGGARLRYIGPLAYNSVMLRSALTGCEFFAMPSLLETPSIAALEAAAAGAKVLLTEVGSTREYFGNSVTFVDPLSQESLINGIATARSASNETSKWVVHNSFLWSKAIPALLHCYRSLLDP